MGGPDDTPGARRPNLVVVLLDCVRAASFPGTGGSAGRLPTLERLASESTVYRHASTVAPWTLPSHASLFTGVYPWEHGVMGDGRMQFDDSIPNVAGLLRGAGYATLAFSANGIISPLLSARGSFESYRCAEWWEKTFRWIEPEALGGSADDRPRSARTGVSILAKGLVPGRARVPHRTLLRAGDTSASLETAVRNARPEEAPLSRRADTALWSAIDGANRIARTLRAPTTPQPLPIASWIEASFGSWLGEQRPDQPIFTFVNLLDAHEKYLSDGGLVRGIGEWRRFVGIPQNSRMWLEGEWRPTAAELELLRLHYESTVLGLEPRIAAIIAALQRAGRWDDTLFVLTSDHGQAFGEHGELFHERSPYETLLHVPLWVRWPGPDPRRGPRDEHVGLIDVAPTLLRAAGIEPPPGMSGMPLQEVGDRPRSSPVLAMADGFPTIERHRLAGPGPLRERLERSFAVAYSGAYKAIVGVRDGSVQAFDVLRDPTETAALADGASPEVREAVRVAQEAADRIRNVAKGAVDPDVHDRLVSWGYL